VTLGKVGGQEKPLPLTDTVYSSGHYCRIHFERCNLNVKAIRLIGMITFAALSLSSGGLLNILLALLVLALVIWLCIWLIDMLPLPNVPKTIAKVIVAIIALLVIFQQLGVVTL